MKSWQPPPEGANRKRRHERVLARALECAAGPRDWRMWKQAAARSLIELADASPRMEMLALDLSGEFLAVYQIAMPTPRWPRKTDLEIGDMAVFDLMYDESWRRAAPPPTMPLGLRFPPDVFHPNCRPAPPPFPLPGFEDAGARAAVCLGDLQPNVSVRELALIGHDLVSLQSVMLDETDVNRVFNPIACDYFRRRPEYLPLYGRRTGLLEPWTQGEDT